ncbi:MAG: hypothetical protein JXJ17_17840 [Anaerolineae bacterium]|nr:hypothetical protein [Anaerolineae bacterium]
MPTLIRALVDYDPDLLRVIAQQWDIDITATDRVATSEELAEAIVQPEAVEVMWERLDDDDRQALNELQARGGRIPFTHFERQYGEIRPMGPARRERERPWLDPVSVTEKLYYRGLIVRQFDQSEEGMREYIAIPADLMELLPRPATGDLLPSPGYAAAPPRDLKDGHNTAPDDIATILAYLLIRDTNAREWLLAEPAPAIDPYLRRADDPVYRALLVHLAYDLELIADDEVLTHVVTRVDREAARPWLEAPKLHQARSLAETWAESVRWNDLAHTPGLECDDWVNNPLAARHAILGMLGGVPAEIWWSLDGFVEHVKRYNPDYQRPGGDYGAWYIRDVNSDEILHGFGYWDYIDGALLRFIINGPMRWLGVVRFGQGRFLLTPIGLALLGRGEWPSESDRDVRIQVDEQGMISVPVDISRYDRVQISRFAAWICSPPPSIHTQRPDSRDEGHYIYRLTPQAIERATGEKISLKGHIVPFLQRLSGHRLPQNVIDMLEAWEDEPREVIVHDVVIVTVRDLGVYERLQDNERVSRWFEQSIGPNTHIVKRENMPALLNALRDMGILPLFEGHEKDDRPL